VRRERPAVAALLNGVRLPPVAGRPTRGTLALAALRGELPASFEGYDGFHLLHGTPSSLQVWSWDGSTVEHRELAPGNHILVNLGVDTADDPLVPHFAPLLAALPGPPLPESFGAWPGLLAGDGLDPTDDAALLIRKSVEDRTYGSTSACLVGISPTRVRYDFTPTPLTPAWSRVV
jgi:hypothetical protein